MSRVYEGAISDDDDDMKNWARRQAALHQAYAFRWWNVWTWGKMGLFNQDAAQKYRDVAVTTPFDQKEYERLNKVTSINMKYGWYRREDL
jgi:hypothetical protein